MPGIENRVFTIGHSTLDAQPFFDILRKAGVTAVADVRSSPFSRRSPHFNKEELKAALRDNGIKYVFLGKELGGRPRVPALYRDGVADYEKMALEPAFVKGIDRIVSGAAEHSIVLMCSEHNPLDCHRCLLVGRALAERHVPVSHLLHDGRVVDHREIEDRLLNAAEGATGDLFSPREEKLADAYRRRARMVAYREPAYTPADYRMRGEFNHVS